MSTSVVKELVVFIGPPGSGKGSLSQLCTESLGWAQLSTGDLCRTHIQEDTKIGKQIDFFIKNGKLIDDSLMIDMVEGWLSQQGKGYRGVILDGFPRTAHQAEGLQEILTQKVPKFRLNIVQLSAPDDVILRRLLGRFICIEKKCQAIYAVSGSLAPQSEGICDKCSGNLVRRADDQETTIRHRLKTYYAHIQGLMEFYSHAGVTVNKINVEKPLERVFEDFRNVIFGM